jgi:hypothetical protein
MAVEAASSTRVRALPEGSRLVHIGPPKTGTTALQASFHRSREALLAQGVRYVGRRQHSRRAVYAAFERRARPGDRTPPPARLWQAIVSEVREASEPRIVLSSEILTDGGPTDVRRVVDDLDPDRVHVVATLRPLPRILASQWQQGVKGGLGASFDEWLREVFAGRGANARRFWHRHRHDELIRRWADVVGLDRVTVVVVDDRDHRLVLRSFEQLLGLETGTLVEVTRGTNQSMTLEAVEALRSVNRASIRTPLGASSRYRLRRLTRRAMASAPAAPGERRIQPPPWAVERAHEVGDEIVEALLASGVRIVGDVERLRAVGPDPADRSADPGVRASSSVPGAIAAVVSVVARRRLAALRRAAPAEG